MRAITDHRIEGTINGNISITATDPVGEGGANAEYTIVTKDDTLRLKFHRGQVADIARPNGITNEALAAIIIDRLRGVQGLNVTGVAPFPSREGGKALEHFEEGLAWLQKRTRDRISRGVEGKPVA